MCLVSNCRLLEAYVGMCIRSSQKSYFLRKPFEWIPSFAPAFLFLKFQSIFKRFFFPVIFQGTSEWPIRWKENPHNHLSPIISEASILWYSVPDLGREITGVTSHPSPSPPTHTHTQGSIDKKLSCKRLIVTFGSE